MHAARVEAGRGSVVACRRQSSTVRLNLFKNNAELDIPSRRSCALDAAKRHFLMYVERDVASV